MPLFYGDGVLDMPPRNANVPIGKEERLNIKKEQTTLNVLQRDLYNLFSMFQVCRILCMIGHLPAGPVSGSTNDILTFHKLEGLRCQIHAPRGIPPLI
jgi:hypothetical protein